MSDYPDERTVQEWNELNDALDGEQINPPEPEWPDLPPGHYHDPAGQFDYCTDPRCPRTPELSADELAQIQGGWPSMPEPEA